jgi:colanic acid/amylovoran biosynthesis glycosyltransferase
MRLVIVSSRCPFGNREPYLLAELRELTRHFDTITVLPVHSPSGALQPLPNGAGALAWSFVSPEILARAVRMFFSEPRRVFRVLTALARSHERGRLRNACVALKGVALAQWAIEHDIEHIHAYWLSTPATVAMIAGEIASIPWSATGHRLDIYKRNALDVKARSIKFVRTISARGTRDLTERAPDLGDRIVHLPLGAAVPDAPVAELARTGALRIVCPAGLAPRKGQMDVLEAMAMLRRRGVPLACTFAGEGPREGLERRVRALGLTSCVTFAGFVPQKELHEKYRAGEFDVVVMASRGDEAGSVPTEGIPAALLEAMAHGIPIVTTRVGGIGELVDDGCGWITPPDDPGALADALAEAYEHPSEALARAAEAYLRVSARHDVRRQMRTLSERIHA